VRDAGIEVAIISAGSCAAVEHRAATLGIVHARTAVKDKLAELRNICALLGTDLSAVAHVGDDVNDVPVMQAVGFPMSVADAVEEAREAAAYITRRRGGDAAVREICDLLLSVRGT
jgi:3-deoxy-D-manno-octulosonate 8-phosphate phosphatase (KDO 8-P phosphatase)